MPATRYQKAKKILEYLRGQKIGLMRLQNEVRVRIGGDPRTVTGYLQFMLDTGLIRDLGECHFEIVNDQVKKSLEDVKEGRVMKV